MKSYTDLEQSRKLEEILPLKSADMYYLSGDEYDICFGSGVYEEIVDWFSDGRPKPADVPCWSLTALIELMPIYIRINNEDYDFSLARGGAGAYTFSYTNARKEPWELGYDLHLTTHKDSIIDAAFEMVYWLLENKKI